MIKVVVNARKDSLVSVHISGHAKSADKGEDLVCAGVSSVAIGALNALDELCNGKCLLKMKDADILIETTSTDVEVQMILKTLYVQLQTIEQKYSEYIKIVKEEV